VGDWVMADDPTTPGDIRAKQVLQTFVREAISVINLYIDGELITVTEEHPFWVPEQGWVAAKDLHQGTVVQTEGGAIVDVDRVDRRDENVKVYNFEVEGFHTYFVSDLGVLVHNNCARPPSFPSERTGGQSPSVPDGRTVKVEPSPDGLSTRGTRQPQSIEEARRIVRNGGHVYSSNEATASRIAGSSGVGPELHPRAGENRFGHYHLPGRPEGSGHIFFGSANP
jgi:Pretoxin HINT domain